MNKSKFSLCKREVCFILIEPPFAYFVLVSPEDGPITRRNMYRLSVNYKVLCLTDFMFYYKYITELMFSFT